VTIEVLRVNVLNDLRLRNDAAAMMHQIREHTELMARKLHQLSFERDPRPPRVQHDAPDAKLWAGVAAPPAGPGRAGVRALPLCETASTRSRPRRRRSPAPSHANCREP